LKANFISRVGSPVSKTTVDPLDWKKVPKKSGITEKQLIYRQTQIPKDPYAVLPEHATKAKQVVDDMVKTMDTFLDSALSKDNWLHNDKMELIYPN